MNKKLLKIGVIGAIVGVTLATVTQPGFGDGSIKPCFSNYGITGTAKQCSELGKHFERVTSSGYANDKKESPASQIFHDYLSNQIAARDKYHDKALMVTGTVATVSADMMGYPSIVLNTRYEFSFVKLDLADVHFLHPAAAKDNKLISAVEKSVLLRPGDVVHAVCFGGVMSAGTPILEDCVLQ